MADFAIYWRDYDQEAGLSGKPVNGWLTNRTWLTEKLNCGDRIWLFTSGGKCGMAETEAGYLTEIFFVHAVLDNGEADVYGPRFAIEADERCHKIDPPLFIDDIIRQSRFSRERPIGILRQTPWELSPSEMDRLRKRLPDALRPLIFSEETSLAMGIVRPLNTPPHTHPCDTPTHPAACASADRRGCPGSRRRSVGCRPCDGRGATVP